MAMIIPVVQHDAVFKIVSSHSRSGLKQSASCSDAKPVNHPWFTVTSSFLPLHPCCYVQTRATINPVGRAVNRGKYFILFPRGYFVCRSDALKNIGRMETEKQRNRTAN